VWLVVLGVLWVLGVVGVWLVGGVVLVGVWGGGVV
jgi:hypothetical protein